MAQEDVQLTGDRVMSLIPGMSRLFLLCEIDHKLFSVIILSILLIQEGQSSVSSEKRALYLYWLSAYV